MIEVVLAILLAAAAAEPSQVTLDLLDGTTVVGQLTAWDASAVTIDGADGPRQVATAELLAMHGSETAIDLRGEATTIELIDGATFTVDVFTCKDRVASVQSPLGELSIPTELIRRVDLQQPTDASRAMWARLEGGEQAGDALLIVKREGAVDYLTGVVGDVTADEVSFDWDGQKVPIKRTKVAGVAYYHATERRLPAAAFELTLIGGNVLPVKQISLEGDVLHVTLPTGLELDVRLDVLDNADFSAGKLAYLGDLKPTEERWTPRIALPDAAALIASYGAPRNNVSFTGSPLSLAWPDEGRAAGRDVRTYTRGVALRSRTELTYRLPAGMKRFTATAGIDPATTDQGHVLLEIRADGRVIWEGEIDGREPPQEIDVELKSARRLQFLVDYGRNLDYGDRLHLVEARVTQ